MEFTNLSLHIWGIHGILKIVRERKKQKRTCPSSPFLLPWEILEICDEIQEWMGIASVLK